MKIVRFLKWVVFNGAFVVLLYAAEYLHKDWAWNILRFYIGATFVMSMFLLIPDVAKATVKAAQGKTRSVPQWLDVTFDFCFAGGLAAAGNFGWATLYLVGMLIGSNVAYTKIEPPTVS